MLLSSVCKKKINTIEAAFGIAKSSLSVSLEKMKTAIKKGATRACHVYKHSNIKR